MPEVDGFRERLNDKLEDAGETLRKIKGEMLGEANKERREILDDINTRIDELSLESKEVLLDMIKLVKEEGGDWSGTISNDKISEEEKKEIGKLIDLFKNGFVNISSGRPVELDLDEYINKLERDIQQKNEEDQAEELKNKL